MERPAVIDRRCKIPNCTTTETGWPLRAEEGWGILSQVLRIENRNSRLSLRRNARLDPLWRLIGKCDGYQADFDHSL
jgi:hypothetical protein